MRKVAVLLLAALVGCSSSELPDQPAPAPHYGGDPLPHTEYLYNLQPSPDGSRIALVRARTPGVPTDPPNQLWVLNRDGSDPRFIGVNVGGVDWDPTGQKLAVNVVVGVSVYLFTLDLNTMEARAWSGSDSLFFTHTTASWGGWFPDGRRALVSVFGQGFEQAYLRGLYILDTQTAEVEGPLVEYMEAARLGGRGAYATGRKYLLEGDPQIGLSGNYVRYDFGARTWEYITRVPRDSILRVSVIPNPAGSDLVVQREVDGTDQLFLAEGDGSGLRRLTTSGGLNPQWSSDGSSFLFLRDVYDGPGARYVPFVYDLDTSESHPLWPSLPDSVPAFPVLPPPSGSPVGIAN